MIWKILFLNLGNLIIPDIFEDKRKLLEIVGNSELSILVFLVILVRPIFLLYCIHHVLSNCQFPNAADSKVLEIHKNVSSKAFESHKSRATTGV